jgi:hypothetical protein
MMKYFALFIATTGLACAADFATGQAARLVLGQTTFTQQDEGASQTLLGGVSGVAYANNLLFVADSNRVGAAPQNNRVLLFSGLSGMLPAPTAAIDQSNPFPCAVCLGSASVVLGQPDFSTTDIGLTQNSLRTPTAVATDGRILAVADTDNNRVLLWLSIPSNNGQPADVVVGQPDFKTASSNFGGGNTPSAKGMRGPQGVWIQSGRLFVADTQNHRVLIWNSIPSANGTPADLVLGQPNFTTYVEPDLTKAQQNALPNNLLNPVSVTSDGIRLYITDLGHNRVVIYNSIPTANGAPADLAIGQPSLSSDSTNPAIANNSALLCASNGVDSSNNPTYPARCAATMDFPRFALSDGQRLFVSDGGNNRILVYNSIPTQTGQRADVILGEPDEFTSNDDVDLEISSSDTLRTPMSLAWDGTNLYVGDSFNRRVMVFTLANPMVSGAGVRNAASLDVFAVGTVAITGTITAKDVATITIAGKDYPYTVTADDTIATIITKLAGLINANGGDPNVFAREDQGAAEVVLTSKATGDAGNAVTLTTTVSTNATIVLTASGATLLGGGDAAKIAPGTIVTIYNNGSTTFTSQTASADATKQLPTTLGGIQVYADGIRAPLLMVSPTQINFEIPVEVSDRSSLSVYVRSTNNASVLTSTAVGVPIVPQNPGIFADTGSDPRPAMAYHYSSYATGAISVDGTITGNDVATVTIEDRSYSYTVQSTDSLDSVRDQLIALINQDERVTATAAGPFDRIRLQARVPGKDGEGIVYGASVNTSATIILSPLSPNLCCSNTAGARVTQANPAQPGETIVVYATGLGQVLPTDATNAMVTGAPYRGPDLNTASAPVDSLAGAKTANVLFAGLKAGSIGIYEVDLQLNSSLTTDAQTQLTIAQSVYVSNIVTIPVYNPVPPQ